MSSVLLIVYDNDSHIPFFPQHIFYLASALWKAGHSVELLLMDVHHMRTEAITDIIDMMHFDVVGLGFIAGYYQYQKAKEISNAINKSKHRKDFNFVLGGHGPASDPGFFQQKLGADTVVIGDGESAIKDIAETNKKGIIQGEPTEIEEDYTGYYAQFPIYLYRLIRWPTSTRKDFCFPVLSSRGCKWQCSFCYRMRKGYYLRPVNAIIDEIRYLVRSYGITHIQFSDELLMGSEERTVEICETILKSNLKIKWDCNGRLNFAKAEILSLMKRSGCEYINYGIESLNQTILNQMGKGLTVDQIHKGVEATLAQNLSPGLNLLWGFPGNTLKDLSDEVEFLKKYDPCDELRTIRPVTPYPGCSLYNKAIKEGKIKDCEDFYENLHNNSDLISVNFMDIPTSDAHKELYKANCELIKNYYFKHEHETFNQAVNLYLEGDTNFRGFRTI